MSRGLVLPMVLALLLPGVTAQSQTLTVPAFHARSGLMAPVREVFAELGFRQTWDPLADTITLTGEACALTFTIGGTQVSVRDAQTGSVRESVLQDKPRYVRGRLHVPLTALWDLAGLPYRAEAGTRSQATFVVAGHTITAQIMTPHEESLTLETTGSVVKFETTKGDIVLELFDTTTPVTVGSFLELVGRGYYDGLTFHRVIRDFMIQGGCPLGNGTGGPGFTIPDEADKGLKHERGSLSMAKTAAPNTGGSQFFICHVPCRHLDGVHTVFGKTLEGLDVVDAIQMGDRIRTATIITKSADADAAITAAEAARVPER